MTSSTFMVPIHTYDAVPTMETIVPKGESSGKVGMDLRLTGSTVPPAPSERVHIDAYESDGRATVPMGATDSST